MVTYVLIALIVIILGYIIVTYNELVGSKFKIKQAKANIDLLLKQRFDYIPNLEEIVKAYSSHEKNILTDIAALRSNIASSKLDIQSEEQFSSEFSRILATVESYPELQANQQYITLQSELADIEDQLVVLRSNYNSVVTRHNIYISTFPTVIFAKLFLVRPASLFEVEAQEMKNINLNFK